MKFMYRIGGKKPHKTKLHMVLSEDPLDSYCHVIGDVIYHRKVGLVEDYTIIDQIPDIFHLKACRSCLHKYKFPDKLPWED